MLPNFLVLSAAFSLGLMEATAAETATHLNGTRLEHLDQTLAQQQTVRLDFARLRLQVDQTRAFLEEIRSTRSSLAEPTPMLRVLEVKAVAASEASLQVTDLAMKLCRRRRLPQRAGHRAPLPRRARRAGDGPHHGRAAGLSRPRRAGVATARSRRRSMTAFLFGLACAARRVAP